MQQSFVRFALALLLVHAGCAGEVGSSPEQRSERDSGRRVRDASNDAARSPQQTTRKPEEPALEVETSPSEVLPVADDAGLGSSASCAKGAQATAASGLKLRELALYQTVKVPLVKDGAWVQESSSSPAWVPVVEGKRALVRALVETLPGYKPHAVRAVLTIKRGATVSTLEDQRTLSASSSEAQLASGFTFELEGSELGPDTELAISLEEPACTKSGGSAGDTRFPADGTRPLETLPTGKLRVVLVPIVVAGRAPLTSEAELAKMQSALLAYYPVPAVELTLRKPVEYTGAVGASASDEWSDLLTQLMRLRRQDAVSDDVYYFGLMQPGASFNTYCQRGCVLGLAPQTLSVSPAQQVALGASFANDQTYETMVHELGHAHGRGHSPCATGGAIIDGVDTKFPNARGETATWGWDSRSSKLMPPTSADIMGYCKDNWISGYHYSAIATRSSRINAKALRFAGAGRFHHVVLYESGAARWGGSFETSLPGGNVEPATVLDAEGNVLETIEVARIPLSHQKTEFLYLPDPGASWAAVRFASGRILKLAEILPPR